MSQSDDHAVYEGQWWVPDQLEEKLLGTLTFNAPDELRLELKVPTGFARSGNRTLKIIHGLDQHAHPVTLFYCFVIRESQSAGITTFVYSVGYSFHGVHLRSWRDAIFDEVDVGFTNLEEWVAISGFKSQAGDQKGWQIEYERPQELEFDTGKGFKFVLAANVSHNSGPGEFQSINQQWLIRLTYDRPTAFRNIRDHLTRIRRFLILAIGRPVRQKGLTLSLRAEDKRIGVHRFRRDVICYAPTAGKLTKPQRLHTFNLIFSFPEIRETFGAVLQSWFSYSERFSDSLSLYFSTVENRYLYSNHVFLFLAQALEVYHRSHTKKFRQSVEAKDTFQHRLSKIAKALSPEDARWISAKVRHANEPSLNQRLLEIFESKRSILGGYLKDEGLIARQIRDTRNHYTHYTGKSRKSHVVEGTDGTLLCYRMQVVLQVCFLSDIGIPTDIIRKLLKDPNWTVVEFTEMDSDEPQPTTTVPTLRLTAPRKRGNRKKKSAKDG